MIRGPRAGVSPVDYVARVAAVWAPVPDWVTALAEEATVRGIKETAKRLGYSPSVVSEVLSGSYRGDLGRVEAIVHGALLGATVVCPVLDEISRDRCLKEQRTPFKATNSTRSRLARACRTCDHRKERS